MDSIPFDGIITLFVFLIGVPALVFQLMDPEIRRVVLKRRNFWIETPLYVLAAIIVVVTAIALEVWSEGSTQHVAWTRWVWSGMFLLLFFITAVVAIRVPYHYGRRENIVSVLKREASNYLRRKGYLPDSSLSDLIDLAKQSDPGKDRELILSAFNDLVVDVCMHPGYQGDALETLINELVNVLTSEPDPEDLRNFQSAAGIMTNIIALDGKDKQSVGLKDRQHAVRALSVLEQTILSHFTLSLGADYILMGYVQVLGLAADRFPVMTTDVSQAFFEIGSLAIDKKQTLIAASVMEKLLSLGERNAPLKSELAADLLGLTAHFWTSGLSNNKFACERLSEIQKYLETPLQIEIDKASLHCQKTMQFDTADKLSKMAEDIKRGEKTIKFKSTTIKKN